jgi:osmotically-inducible protein OsmY
LQPTELDALELKLSEGDDVRERHEALLVEHGVDTLAVTIDVTGGRVRLGGAVDDRLSALLIEDLAWTLPDVTHCDSALQVRGEDWSLAS